MLKTPLGQRWLYWSQLSISLGLMGWIVVQVNPSTMLAFYPRLSPATLFFLVMATVANITVQFWRWRWLIREYSTDFRPQDLLPSFFAGFAFRLILPGGHAEITKIFLLPGRKRGKVLAFGMERFFQTFIKLLFLVAALAVLFPRYRLPAGLLVMVLRDFYFWAPSLSFWEKIEEKPGNGRRTFVQNFYYSGLMFLCLSAQYYLIFRNPYPLKGSLILATTALLWSSGLVPFTISGMGIREWLASYLFPLQGITAADAVAATLFIFFLNSILPAVIGVYYIHRRRHHLKDIPPTIRDSVRQLKDRLRSSR